MTDDFALLGEPRRPWLDPGHVRATYLRLSREQHPDAASGAGSDADFARLNHAQATLTDPKSRLRLLLELEYPGAHLAGPSTVPLALASFFAPVLTLLRDIDALLAKKAAAPSALSHALLARQELALREMAERLLHSLDQLHTAALDDLRALDAAWDTRPPDACARLIDLHSRFAYLSRWIDQLRERIFLLGA